MEVALMPFGLLLAALEGIHDPRRPQGQRYSLSHLLLFSVLAVLAGATSYQKIITFIAVQRDRLNAAFGACLRRAPAVNTLRRLFLTLDQDDLEGAFRRHAHELNGTVPVTGKRTIALDGKTLRGSFDHLNDRKAAHVLSAFASDAALILAHQEVAGAPGEIPAVPTLITELGVSGVLFTADALHCQKDSVTRAAETDNGLLVQVKRNQPTLHDTLAKLCAEHHPFDSHETVDRRRHGRQEHRLGRGLGTARPPGAPAGRGVRHRRSAGYRVAAADCLRRPGLAPDLREGHPVRSVAEPRGDRLLCLPDPPRCRAPRPRRPLALGN